jgi:hypothetical protein
MSDFFVVVGVTWAALAGIGLDFFSFSYNCCSRVCFISICYQQGYRGTYRPPRQNYQSRQQTQQQSNTQQQTTEQQHSKYQHTSIYEEPFQLYTTGKMLLIV